MMDFTIHLPEPDKLKIDRISFHKMESGTLLHRIHSDLYGSADFNASDRGDARFSPIQNPDGVIIPTVYAGETFECAVGETILRCPDVEEFDPATGQPVSVVVSPHKWRKSIHSTVETLENFRLVDITTQGQRRIGVNKNALLAGPTETYSLTRKWAEAIYAACPDAHGLYYTSHQFGPKFAIVLFGDRVDAGIRSAAPQRSVAEKGCDREIRALADSLGIIYEDI